MLTGGIGLKQVFDHVVDKHTQPGRQVLAGRGLGRPALALLASYAARLVAPQQQGRAIAIAMAGLTPWAIYLAVAIWGLAFGGTATLFQTALAKRAGEAADVAQSMRVTVWNMAIAGGGLLGGVLL